MGQVSHQQWVDWQALPIAMVATWQAVQQGAKRLQALGIQLGERLACAVPAGQFERAALAPAACSRRIGRSTGRGRLGG
jgi:hypothetical protein